MTTGVPDGVSLAPSGPLEIVEDGAVIEGLDVAGPIDIRADNVTIRNSRITFDGQPYGIRVHQEHTGAVIEDVEIVGSGGCNAGIVFASYTARRVDVSGCFDGLKAGSNTTIVDSFIHDLDHEDGAHSDGIQTSQGSNIRIIGNRIEGRYRGSVSAILVKADLGEVRDYVIRDNLLSGGGYTMYLTKRDGMHIEDVQVIGNVWRQGTERHGLLRLDEFPGLVWSDNVDESGEAISID